MQRVILLISVICVLSCETPSVSEDKAARISVFGDALFLPVIGSEQVLDCRELGINFESNLSEKEILEVSKSSSTVPCVITAQERAEIVAKGYADYLVNQGFEIVVDPYSDDRLILLCGDLGAVSLDPAPDWDDPDYAVLESDSPAIQLTNEKRLILAGYLPREAWAIPDAPCGMEG